MRPSMFQDFFWYSQLRHELREVTTEAGQGARAAAEVRETVDRLVLACQAMWALLSEQTGITDEKLLEKIREIDLLDGTLDGKVRRPPKACASCGRPNGAGRDRCIYCGGKLAQKAFP